MSLRSLAPAQRSFYPYGVACLTVIAVILVAGLLQILLPPAPDGLYLALGASLLIARWLYRTRDPHSG